MYLHFADHHLSYKIFFDILWNSTDFEFLYIQPINQSNAWAMNFYMSPPPGEGWVKVKDSEYDNKTLVLQHWTFMGLLNEHAKRYPTDTGERWRQAGITPAATAYLYIML